MFAEVVGELVGGAESVTFSGALFDGLCQLRYRTFINCQGPLISHGNVEIQLATWDGRSVRCLPYPEKFLGLCRAISTGQQLSCSVEIEGREIFSSNSLILMPRDDAAALVGVLTYLLRARDLLEALGADVPFCAASMTLDEAQVVQDAWNWICRLKLLSGTAIGEVCSTLVPGGDEAVRELRQRVQSGEPTLIRFEQEPTHPLKIMGQTILCGSVTTLLTSTVLKVGGNISSIRVGRPVTIRFVATDSCRASVLVGVESSREATGMSGAGGNSQIMR